MTGQIYFLIILFLFTSLILAFIPYLTRKTENFGVSIPASLYDRDDFKAMRKKYMLTLLIVGIFLATVLFILVPLLSQSVMYIVYTIILLAYIVAAFILYLPFHFKMKQLKAIDNWQEDRKQSFVVDIKFRQEKLIYSNWWFLTSLIIIIATITATLILYDHIPDKIPMHTDISGNVTYEAKSIGNLLFLPGTQVFMLIVFICINFVIKNSKQQVSAENPEKSKQQNIIFRRRWSAYLIWTAALTQILIMFLQLTLIFPTLLTYENTVLFTITIIIITTTLILALTTGQGGSRVKVGERSNENAIDRDDDRYWKLGQFYFNKNDPAIFIEKRLGVGWTNNWAHPASWTVIGVIILAIVVPPIFLI